MNTHKEGLCELLLGFRRKIAESAKKNSLKHELTFSQFETLWFIGSVGKKSMEAIADYLKITPPSATSMIGKMEKKGLVSRMQDVKDRRVIYIRLTKKTKKQLEALWRQKEKMFNKIVSKLSKKDKGNLERIIRTLIKD